MIIIVITILILIPILMFILILILIFMLLLLLLLLLFPPPPPHHRRHYHHHAHPQPQPNHHHHHHPHARFPLLPSATYYLRLSTTYIRTASILLTMSKSMLKQQYWYHASSLNIQNLQAVRNREKAVRWPARGGRSMGSGVWTFRVEACRKTQRSSF